jgi:hypothetical protein
MFGVGSSSSACSTPAVGFSPEAGLHARPLFPGLQLAPRVPWGPRLPLVPLWYVVSIALRIPCLPLASRLKLVPAVPQVPRLQMAPE